jgi:hypothetical protein
MVCTDHDFPRSDPPSAFGPSLGGPLSLRVAWAMRFIFIPLLIAVVTVVAALLLAVPSQPMPV